MSPEISPQLLAEKNQTINRPIASFARIGPEHVHIDLDNVRAYIGSQLLRRENPYFYKGEQRALTGLEPYLIGITSSPIEVAEEIGRYGDRALKSLEDLSDSYVIPRVSRIISTGKISTDVVEKKEDLKVLLHADIALGNAVRRLQAGMTKEAEDFRAQTHEMIGDPNNRFTYSPSLHSESLVLPQIDPQRREIDVQKQPIDMVLTKLPIHLQKGYDFLSKLLNPVLSAPIERAFLLGLRDARI